MRGCPYEGHRVGLCHERAERCVRMQRGFHGAVSPPLDPPESTGSPSTITDYVEGFMNLPFRATQVHIL